MATYSVRLTEGTTCLRGAPEVLVVTTSGIREVYTRGAGVAMVLASPRSQELLYRMRQRRDRERRLKAFDND